MRGQLVLLTALVVAIALTAILAAQLAVQMGQQSAGIRHGYGIYAKPWPEVVDLADSHTLQAVLKASSLVSTGGLTTGLYGDPALVYNVAGGYVNKTFTSLRQNLLPLGAQLSYSYGLKFGGFNGSLGPYPQAVELSSWNLESFRGGRVSIPGGVRLYRLTVTWNGEDYDGYYVVTYGGHVSEPGALGEDYNTALAELLDGLRAVDMSSSLYLFLVNNDTIRAGRCEEAFIQLPWWAEVAKCPLCLLHVRIPSSVEVGSPVLRKGKTLEILLVYAPNYVGDVLPALCVVNSQVYPFDIPINKSANNNPHATFATQVIYNNGAFKDYNKELSWFWSGEDIASWSRRVVRDQCRSNPVTGGVDASGVKLVPDGGFEAAEIWADYQAGTRNWGFNVYMGPVPIQGWRGATVEALVRPLSLGTIRPARLDLYYYTSPPDSTHPICANVVAIQAVSPVLVWSSWRGGSGVWNGRTWDDAGAISFGDVWYLYSISFTGASTLYNVYLYNSTRPLVPLGGKRLGQAPWGTTDWRFYIVLGSAIVDNPASTTAGWREAARYAYVRVRPYVEPPPSVALSRLEYPPLARPNRVDIVARGSGSVNVVATLSGGIGLAGVENLAIVRRVSLNATIVKAATVSRGPNQATYSYTVAVNTTVPRGTLSAAFSLFYSLGSTYVNKTCPSELCSVTLSRYYGYFGGVDRAEYNITFTVPTWVSHAVLINIFGAKVALSNTKPQLYSLRLGRSYYIINEGNGTAVLTIPWQGQRPVVDISPTDSRYMGIFDVSTTTKQTIVLIPPGSVVNITFRTPPTQLDSYLPHWQRPITPINPPCQSPKYVRIYFPGNASLQYYTLLIHAEFSQTPRAYEFIGGTWRELKVYGEGTGRLWIRVESPSMPLSGRAVLMALCGGGTNDLKVFDYFARNIVDVSQWASLSTYPDGFTAVISATSQTSVALYNDTLSWQCSPNRLMVGIQRRDLVSVWWWHYDGFCFDMHIWEYSRGAIPTIVNYTISISPSMVLYQVVTSGEPPWWFRSYPNSAPALGGRPMTAFRRVTPSLSVAFIPFTWPRPYYYLDFGDYKGRPYSTT
ncbi:MAG: hypothetical protein ACK4SY_06890 [Pyrobaculum sp.]